MNLLRRLFGGEEPSRAVRKAERAIHDCFVARSRLRRIYERGQRLATEAKTLLEQTLRLLEEFAEEAEDWRNRLKGAEEAIDALRAEHEVDAEYTIKRLASSLKAAEAEQEARIAEAEHRRAAVTPVRREEI